MSRANKFCANRHWWLSIIVAPLEEVVVVVVRLQHFQAFCSWIKVLFFRDKRALWKNWCVFNQNQHNVPPLKSRSTVRHHLAFGPCTVQVPTRPPGANTLPTALQERSHQTHTAEAEQKATPRPNRSLKKKKAKCYHAIWTAARAPVCNNIQTWLTERHRQCFTKKTEIKKQ